MKIKRFELCKERCIDEVTEEDMTQKVFHEEFEHGGGGEAEGAVVLRKRNRSVPWSNEDEWEFWSR